MNRVDKGVKKNKGLSSKVILDGLFNHEVDSEFDPVWVVNHFKWELDHTFRFINKEGFEKMVKITASDWLLKDSTFVPMNDLLTDTESLYYHYIYNG